MNSLEWRDYEEYIFEKLSEEFPDCQILFDQKVVGLFSGTARQVDILIKGNLGGHPIVGAVECKCFNNNLDIKDVDSFVGFLEDINANLGIMITKTGYSQAAKNRTLGTRIKLEVINWEEFHEYHIDWQHCICEPEHDKDWHPGSWALTKKTRHTKWIEVLQCQFCYSHHVRCKKCESVLFFPEATQESDECACGLKVQILNSHIKVEHNAQKGCESARNPSIK